MTLWRALLLAFLACLAVPLAGKSPGWVGFGGLPLVIDALRRILVLTGLPGPLVLALVAGFLAALTVFGRPDNGFWGFMAAPFVLLGLPLLVREGRGLFKR